MYDKMMYTDHHHIDEERFCMTMTSMKMTRLVEESLSNEDLRTSYNRENDQLRIEWKESKKGLMVELPPLIAKYNDRGEDAVQEVIKDIKQALQLMNEEHSLINMEKHIYPVIRATSFPRESGGKQLVTMDHTAETRIYYALDLQASYRLIDEAMLEEASISRESLHEMAMFNVRSLPYDYKQDEVNDNTFYFLASQDGYDASRILNESFLNEMEKASQGDMAVAVPHQDVLIVADIKNDTGYDILAQMTMRFFSEGRVPITALPFIYEEGRLEPIFILARNKPQNRN